LTALVSAFGKCNETLLVLTQKNIRYFNTNSDAEMDALKLISSLKKEKQTMTV